MNQWNLKLSHEVNVAMEKAIEHHPHLEDLIHQRIQALLDFPPKRWVQIHPQQDSATFFPEPGQKVRLSGRVDFRTHTVEITRFSIHE